MYPIEYSLLPNFHNLFIDYVSFDEKATGKINKFFSSDYRNSEHLKKVIEDKSYTYNVNRYFDKNILSDILKRQNVTFDGGEKTASNIELLKYENTFAIVTGQQVGLYTGNLYTIYKTVTCIKLALELKQKYPTYNFIPVFWLESDDHDFEEMNHIHILDKDNNISRIGFDDGSEVTDEEENVRKDTKPVGDLVFGEEIKNINEKISELLHHTEFTEELLSNLNKFYKEGINFKTAFARMMNWIFRNYGLVFIDPSDQEIKKLLIPVFEKELSSTPVLCEKIINVSAELEKEYDLQVKPKVINIFYRHNGNRLMIEPRDSNRFALKNSKKRFEREELLNILYDNPELFSANVVLRPICQDYLLPTVVYVGGPAEVSYFAQFKPSYEHYEITMPMIYPRASVTILENKIKKFLNTYSLEFKDVFHHRVVVSKVVDKTSEIKIDDEIIRALDEFNSTFYNLKKVTGEIDKTLLNTLDGIRGKLEQSLDIFKGKLTNAMMRKSDIATAQLDKIISNLYPNKNLQERVINVIYYLNKYENIFINKLFEETDINNFNHQVIEL